MRLLARPWAWLGVLALGLWAHPSQPGTSARPAPKAAASHESGALIEVEVRDIVPLEGTRSHAVMLVNREGTVLPVFVPEAAAVAIAFRMAKLAAPTTSPEDLLDAMIDKMGGKVTEVRLQRVEDGTSECAVLIRQGGRTVTVSARPSDSIAMALTSGAPIFVPRRVIDSSGITREELRGLNEGRGVGGSGEVDVRPPQPSAQDAFEL